MDFPAFYVGPNVVCCLFIIGFVEIFSKFNEDALFDL